MDLSQNDEITRRVIKRQHQIALQEEEIKVILQLRLDQLGR
jgi:hypothetical protein